MGAFHAYDIRGIYNHDFNKDDAYKIGFFLPRLLNTNRVLVGRDVRVSSPEIYEYLTNGITDAGANVVSIGICTTPMVYWSTASLNFDASVMITASHNPREYNGMKVSRTGAMPVGFANGLGELQRMITEDKIVVADKKGTIEEIDVKEKYLEFLSKYKNDVSNLKIAVDCSNGMGGLLIHDILGDQPTYIYDELDGTFPNHEANPLVQENVADLKKLVLETKSDIGVIFDGDADRVMFVDEKGKFISPDLMIGVLGHYFLNPGDTGVKVIQDVRTSKAVGEYLAPMGGQVNSWRVGRAFAAPKLKEIDGLFGGELAGHYYFKDFFYSDSAMMATLIILDVVAEMKRKGISLSELISNISKYANSGEINYKIDAKQAAMDAVKEHFMTTEESTKFMDFDGYRIEFADWWLSIRPSNTEPYLRLLAEAKSEDLLNEKIAKIDEIIKSKM